MKLLIPHDTQTTLKTLQESDRNFYSRSTNIAWDTLRKGGAIEIRGEFSDSGWALIFVIVNGVEYQLTKKQLRQSDLKYYFGGAK